MKKILAIAVALIMVLALTPMIASANVTEVTTAQGLLDAMAAGGNIQLGANITLAVSDYVQVKKDVTLDLNGYTVNYTAVAGSAAGINYDFSIYGDGTDFTINDSSNGSGYIKFDNNYCNIGLVVTNSAKLIVNGGNVEAFYYPLMVTRSAKFEMNGGRILATGDTGMAISGNGSASYAGATTITINGGVIETMDKVHGDANGIFHPQQGTLTINGGLISSGTGICMHGGTLVMNGGTVTGMATSKANLDGSGSKGDGSAICVVNNNGYTGYETGATLDIKGGVLNSCYSNTVYNHVVSGSDDKLTEVKIGAATLTTPLASAFYGVKSEVIKLGEDANIQTGVTSLVRANASPTFTIIIPALVDFGELTNSGLTLVQPFNVELTNALLEPGAQVEVSVVSDFTMDNGGDGTRAYTVTNEAKTQTVSGNIYVIFTKDDTDEGTAACVDNILQAGAYTDTMVFSVFYRP